MTVTGLQQLVDRLGATQWGDPLKLVDAQRDQLLRLARHAQQHSAYFAARLSYAQLQPEDLGIAGGLVRLPVMTRRDVQTAGAGLFCDDVPREHGGAHHAETSGSTGEPVVIRKTGLTRFIWMAMTMRDHAWHRRDLTGSLCVVRAQTGEPRLEADWGPPASLFGPTGPALLLPIATDAARLFAQIAEFAPQYLLIYPSALDELARYAGRTGRGLQSLREIRTVGETLHPSMRGSAERTFGVPVIDCYSSREIGYLALTCPDTGRYHVMAEGVIAEVLDASGRACGPGEVGRVTLTDLHNFATPMVRYDIGDYAEVAEPCTCGRSLPTWSRILGRDRNLILMPDGTRHWPITGFPGCRDIAPILQYQLVQDGRESIEVRLVVERPLTATEEDRLRTLFQQSSGYDFAVRFSYFPTRIPPSASGKFDEFVCQVTA
jgi:phenylacetate-CoA ligase